jgi:hypothetical protein
MRLWILAAVALGLFTPGWTQDPAVGGSAFLNQGVRRAWDEAGLQPARRADDAKFLRRVHLDVVGVIPSAAETESFLADPGADKRSRLVERLCLDPRYATHWAEVWSGILAGTSADDREQAVRLKVSDALREMFAKNVPHDEFARRIITASGPFTERPGDLGTILGSDTVRESPLAGYVVNVARKAGDDFPLAMAGLLTRTFLGIRIQCAQCHDHPFDVWTRENFYGMASFFGNVTATRQPVGANAGAGKLPPQKRIDFYHVIADRQARTAGDLSFPESRSAPIKASFLGTGGGVVAGESRRTTFAAHMTREDNLQFARMQVNRLWAHCFGAGLVDAFDDFSARKKSLFPDLLDGLAREFIAHRFDNAWLIRAITGSEAYQLSSVRRRDEAPAEARFAIQRIRALSPEQLLRSTLAAAGLDEASPADLAELFDPGEKNAARGRGRKEALMFALTSQFRSNFQDDEGHEVLSFSGTIPSALLVMNSALSSACSSLKRGMLAAVLKAHAAPEARIRAIFLSVLTRPPTPKELQRWKSHVAGAETGYEDLSWTLLNTSEFLFNH